MVLLSLFVMKHGTTRSYPRRTTTERALSPETVIRDRLTGLDQDISAFSKITYVGAKADSSDPTALLDRLKEVSILHVL